MPSRFVAGLYRLLDATCVAVFILAALVACVLVAALTEWAFPRLWRRLVRYAIR